MAGLLGPVERRHGWQLAEARGERTPAGVQVRVDALLATIPSADWRRIAVGAGSQGPRRDDWARGRLPYLAADGWAPWVLIRRSVAKPQEVAFCRAFGRAEPPSAAVAQVAGTRWVIAEGVARAQGEVGLEQCAVRRWDAWHRQSTRCLLAHAFLEVTRTATHAGATRGAMIAP